MGDRGRFLSFEPIPLRPSSALLRTDCYYREAFADAWSRYLPPENVNIVNNLNSEASEVQAVELVEGVEGLEAERDLF